MAATGELLLLAFRNLRVLRQLRPFHTTSVQCSLYDKRHLEPTFRPEDLAQPIAADDPRNFQPIKAAFNEHTSSLNYDELLRKFIRHITREGNKERAAHIIEETFKTIKLIQLGKYNKAKTEDDKARIELNPMTIFTQAVDNCRPLLTTQHVKRGGVIYQVPIPIKHNYQTYTAMKWLIESASEKDRGVRVWKKLAEELLAASKNEGKSVRKKQELHRLCEANRAYAHFRW